jgi:hypothetical protein
MWISKNEPLILRVIVITICTLLIIEAIWGWYQRPHGWGSPVMTVITVILCIRLARMSALARSFVVVLLSLPVFPLVGGFINPFGSYYIMFAGQTPPPLTTILVIIIPPLAGILFCLHVLGKYQDRFH